jgi:transcriptional regulator with XRE-family HTH domain
MAGLRFGSRIKKARVKLGLSQAELARKLNVSQPTIANWENETRQRPSKEQRKQLKDLLWARSGESRSAPTPGETSGTGDFMASAIGAWLNRTRLERRLSVPILASKSGVSALAIYNLESGRSKRPQLKTVAKLENALGESLSAEAREEAKEEAVIEGLGKWVDSNSNGEREWPCHVARSPRGSTMRVAAYPASGPFQGLSKPKVGCNKLSGPEATDAGQLRVGTVGDIISQYSGDFVGLRMERRGHRSEYLVIAGEPVRFSKIEAALLRCLHAELGRVVPYKRLGLVFGDERKQDGNLRLLRQHMSTMKRRLEQCKSHYVIAVAYGVGYVLCECADKE